MPRHLLSWAVLCPQHLPVHQDGRPIKPSASKSASLWGGDGGAVGGAPADEEAEKAKEEGNKAFAKGNFALAAESFTLAINLDPNNHVYYANRSAALLKMGKLEDALDDADRAIKLNRFYAKAHYRKGQALAVIGRFCFFSFFVTCLSSIALSSGLDTKAAST